MLITQGAYTAIMRDLASRPFQREQGGILLGPNDTPDLVTHYVKDEWGTGRTTSFTISPDHLNRIIDSVRSANITCVGLVHSHPPGICQASHGDMQFLHRIFSNPKNGGGRFLFPIVCNGKLHPYIVDTSDVSRIVTADLLLV
ncbi:MAG: Mov34/MPN/PAD-1 family protein [Planctomycetaceae bacterium]